LLQKKKLFETAKKMAAVTEKYSSALILKYVSNSLFIENYLCIQFVNNV
jgi:hypothetical protein